MKQVLEYLFDRIRDKRPVTHNVDGQEYAVKFDGTLGEPVRELAPQWYRPTLEVNTLAGLVDAYKAQVDDFPADEVALHIVSHLEVQLVHLKADKYGHRHVWVRARHTPDTPFVFGQYQAPEAFRIAFQSSFYINEEAVKVLQLCGTVGSGEAVLVSDDGISQEVNVKSGTVTKASVTLPADGVPLIPWRTFREVHPVESKFLLRMKGVKDSLPHIALFEIDAKWKLYTVEAIRRHLQHELKDAKIIA
jgi:hypothetical protein